MDRRLYERSPMMNIRDMSSLVVDVKACGIAEATRDGSPAYTSVKHSQISDAM
jgi:hypothetical protein